MIELSKVELDMFERGYVSAKLIAAKTGRHVVSIRHDYTENPAAFESVAHGRWLKFFSLKSVRGYYAALYPFVDFDDWSDIVEGSAPARKKKAR